MTSVSRRKNGKCVYAEDKDSQPYSGLYMNTASMCLHGKWWRRQSRQVHEGAWSPWQATVYAASWLRLVTINVLSSSPADMSLTLTSTADDRIRVRQCWTKKCGRLCSQRGTSQLYFRTESRQRTFRCSYLHSVYSAVHRQIYSGCIAVMLTGPAGTRPRPGPLKPRLEVWRPRPHISTLKSGKDRPSRNLFSCTFAYDVTFKWNK